MKYYGLDKELVDGAILYDIHSKQEDFRYLYSFGKFFIKDNNYFYSMEICENQENMEFKIGTINVDINTLNQENCKQGIIKYKSLSNDEYITELLISFGEDGEQAMVELERQVIENYCKYFEIKSKHQLKEIIENFKNMLLNE